MRSRIFRLCLSSTLFSAAFLSSGAQQQSYTFKSNAELVLVNVTVRDKSSQFVRNLKADDFTVLEDGKPHERDPGQH